METGFSDHYSRPWLNLPGWLRRYRPKGAFLTKGLNSALVDLPNGGKNPDT